MQTNTFIFKNTSNPHDTEYCRIKVSVEQKTYDNNTWYDITYDNHYSCENAKKLHPLYHSPDSIYGQIIVKNDMSTAMITRLLKDFKTIAKDSGNSTPQHDKAIVMKMISLYWD